MIENNRIFLQSKLPTQPVEQRTLPTSNIRKINAIASRVFAILTPPAWMAVAATTGLRFTATPLSIAALVISAVALITHLVKRYFPTTVPNAPVDFNQVHKTLLKAYFEAENFEQTKERLLPLKLFGKNDDIAKFFTEKEIEQINLKFISLFLQPDGPTEMDELVQCTPYMALLTDETANWIFSCLHARPIFQQHVDTLEKTPEVTAETINSEISFIENHSHVIFYEFRKNSKAWRHYFFEIAQMIKHAPEDQRKTLGNAFYNAITPVEAERESFSNYLDRFHKEGDARYVLHETLMKPAPHGQIALNIAVASGLIDLSQPPENPLVFELANMAIAEEVINRLTSTMCYHQIDLNCRDPQGNTLLHMAVQQQNVPLVMALSLNGAKFDLTNNDGATALFLARDRTGNSNQPNAAIIYQTLLFGLTQKLALQRLMPINVAPTKLGGTPLSSKLNKGKKIKQLAHVQKVVGGKAINPQAFRSLGDGFGFVANIFKIGESNQVHLEAIDKLQKDLEEAEAGLKNSAITPEGKEALKKRVAELKANINELNDEKQRAQNSVLLEAGKNGAGFIQNVLKWAPTPAKVLSRAIPLLDFASNAISVWQNYESADENSIKKSKDEQLLKLVEEECYAIENMRNSFEDSQFVHQLLTLKLMERVVQKRFLEHRIEQYEIARVDAGIEGRAAGVQVFALATAVAFPPAAPAMAIATAVATQASPIRAGARYIWDYFHPTHLPEIQHYEPQLFEAYNDDFEERCSKRLGLEKDALDDQIIQKLNQMNPEDEEWFLAMINQAGIPCTRAQFADDKPFYILRYIVD